MELTVQSLFGNLNYRQLIIYLFPQSGGHHDNYKALWFDHCEDPITGEPVHIYKGGYWEAKDRGSWEDSPDIF